MIAYKGFKRDMTCRGYQYAEGQAYTTDKADLCNAGFHACENPLDCFRYYTPGESVYHEVELEGLDDKKGDDSKVCGSHIKIGARLDVAKICKIHFAYVKSRTTKNEQGENSSSLAARAGSSLAARNYSSLAAGKHSVLAAFNSKAKADTGSLIVLANREWVNGEYVIIDLAAGIVDGEKIKPNTWYTVKNGQFVEAQEENENADG